MRVIMGVMATLGMLLLGSGSAQALDSSTPAIEYFSPIFVSAFQTSRQTQLVGQTTYATDSLEFIELHNDTDEPVNMSGWSLTASDNAGLICTVNLTDWLLPDDYVSAASTTTGMTDQTGNVRFYNSCQQDGRTITQLQLISSQKTEETITVGTTGAFARKGLTKTYRTGTFSKDFITMAAAGRTSMYAGVWYSPADDTPLRISEILPRARECSPSETRDDCRDYVKLYNSSSAAAVLDGQRLRIGYQGQSSTSSNTFALGGVLPAGQYAVISADDGGPISITNDGGYVWLEDVHGIIRYDETIVSYPNASSTTKQGWVWALDNVDSVWKWSSTPTPYNQPSVFTLPVEEPPAVQENELEQCDSNQYRNPLTNRCKLIASTTSGLQACASNQYRSPETNRCRLVSSTAGSALKSCAAHQYRNPETNRCKNVASTASSLKPCGPNQERNTTTNRCRDKVVNVAADFPIEAIAKSGEATMGWWAFGGVGMLAAGYAGWEWRSEVTRFIKKAVAFVASGR